MDEVRKLADMSGAILALEYEGSSLDAIRQMVSIEMGISLFPELYVRTEFAKDEGIKVLPVTDWQGTRDIGFFWRRSSARGKPLPGSGQTGEPSRGSIVRPLISINEIPAGAGDLKVVAFRRCRRGRCI